MGRCGKCGGGDKRNGVCLPFVELLDNDRLLASIPARKDNNSLLFLEELAHVANCKRKAERWGEVGRVSIDSGMVGWQL